ncbi:hypothetical protein ACJBXI_10350, partial [Streptococcus suis]
MSNKTKLFNHHTGPLVEHGYDTLKNCQTESSISPNNAVDIWQKALSKLAFDLVVIAEVSQLNFSQNFCSAVYFLFVLYVLCIL